MALSALALRCGKFAADSPAPESAAEGGAAGEPAEASAGQPAGGVAGEPDTGSITSGMPGESPRGGGGAGGAGADGGPSPPLVLRAERSILVSDPAVLEPITFERLLWRLAGDGAEELYRAVFLSFTPRADAPDDAGPRCDDESPADDGVSTLNGFAIPCPAEASSLAWLNATKVWKPLSVTNRFDLAPSGGEHCGEQHLAFYLDRNGTGLPPHPTLAQLRFSAVVNNPSPELGLEGCRPLVDFWASLSREDFDAPQARAVALETVLFGTSITSNEPPSAEITRMIRANFRPLMSSEHFGRQGRLQLAYLGDAGVWHFFEHALVSADEGYAIRRPLSQSLPVRSLVSQDPSVNVCASELIGSIPWLLDDDPMNQRLDVSPSCFAGTDDNVTPSFADGLRNLVPGGTYGAALATEIARTLSMRYPQHGLSPSDIANRAELAGTCHGCHDLSGPPFANPGTLAHVNHLRTEPCGSAGGDEQRRCYARSPLLKVGFLPRWTALLQRVWDAPGGFPPLPGGAASTTTIDGTRLVRQNP